MDGISFSHYNPATGDFDGPPSLTQIRPSALARTMQDSRAVSGSNDKSVQNDRNADENNVRTAAKVRMSVSALCRSHSQTERDKLSDLARMQEVNFDDQYAHSDDDLSPIDPLQDINQNSPPKKTRPLPVPIVQSTPTRNTVTSTPTTARRPRSTGTKPPSSASTKPASKSKNSGTPARPKPRSKAAGKKKGSGLAEVEEDDDELMESLVEKNTWSIQEKGRVVSAIFDPDQDDRFKRFHVDPLGVCTEVAKELGTGRTGKAVRAMMTDLLATYGYLVEFYKITGNGGGDPDGQDGDDEGAIKSRLKHARGEGFGIGNLTSQDVMTFDQEGWYTLFAERYADNPKFNHDSIITSADTPTITKTKRKAAPGSDEVSEHKHKKSKGFQDAANGALVGVNDYLVEKSVTDRARLDHLKRREDREERRDVLEEQKFQFDKEIRKRAESRQEKKDVLELARDMAGAEPGRFAPALVKAAENTLLRLLDLTE